MQYSKSHSTVSVGLLGLAFAAAAPVASAALSVSGDCFAMYTITSVAPPYISAVTSTTSRHCGTLANTDPTPGIWYGGAIDIDLSRASYAARAGYGSVDINVEARGSGIYWGTSTGVASASGKAAASFEDLLRIDAAAGIGATATLEVTAHLYLRGAGGSSVLNSQPDLSAIAQLSFLDATSLAPLKVISRGGELTSGSTGDGGTFVYRFDVPVGRDIQLLGSASGYTAVSYSGPGYSVVNWDTTISVLTPGATLVAASGHNYAPVPEPSSYALMLLGVVALLPTLARRRKARGP